MPPAPVAAPPTTRERIVRLLRERHEIAVRPLAEVLGLSTMAVRKHLDALEAASLVTYRMEGRPVGRPRRLYTLTRAADPLFPQDYERFATDLATEVRTRYGGDALLSIIDVLSEACRRRYQPALNSLDFDASVRRLTALRDADGYMASSRREADGTVVITERNCPLRAIADCCSELCQAEERLFAVLLNADVRRTHSMPEGATACEFAVHAPA